MLGSFRSEPFRGGGAGGLGCGPQRQSWHRTSLILIIILIIRLFRLDPCCAT